MLVLKLSDRERIVLHTPSGDVTLQLMENYRVGIDAPKAWPVKRYGNNESATRPAGALVSNNGGTDRPNAD